MYPQPPAAGQPFPGGPQPVPPAQQPWPGPFAQAPTTAWVGVGPTSGAGGGYPVTSIPPAPDQGGRVRRIRARVLAVLTGVLVVALLGTGTWLAVADHRLHHELATLDAAAAGRRAAQAGARATLAEQFRQADLDGKLQRVRDLTQQAEDALVAWGKSGEAVSGLKTLRDLGNKCDEAVIDYDATAARFPAEMLAALPSRIDITDNATDCVR